MNTMTITVPTGNANEVAYFKLGFTCPLEEFIENVEILVSPECVFEGEEMGFWKIL